MGFRVSPFIFMKIKSDERKRVYKKRREKIKDNYVPAEKRTDPDRRLFMTRTETRSMIFGLLNGIAPAKLDPCDRRTIPRFPDDQKVKLT